VALTVHELPSKINVQTGTPEPVIAPAVIQRVEEIWQHESALRGNELFNGRLFSVRDIDANAITGWMTDYRHFVAQQRAPELYNELKIRPLAVTGALLCDDGVTFGRRTSRATMDADLWELIPSGSVDDVAAGEDGLLSLAVSIQTELQEEIGFQARELLLPPTPFVVIEDPYSHVIDIGMFLHVRCRASAILERFSQVKRPEHTALKVVAIDAIPDFRRAQSKSLAEVSAAMLDVLIPRLLSREQSS